MAVIKRYLGLIVAGFHFMAPIEESDREGLNCSLQGFQQALVQPGVINRCPEAASFHGSSNSRGIQSDPGGLIWFRWWVEIQYCIQQGSIFSLQKVVSWPHDPAIANSSQELPSGIQGPH